MKKCSITNCEKPIKARGLCASHYQNLWRTGDPMRPLVRAAGERALRRVDRSDPAACWVWSGAMDGQGYGHLRAGPAGAGFVRAHIAAYEHGFGKVPDGLELDHLCRNKLCINPAHLEPVTHAENLRRAGIARNDRGQFAKKEPVYCLNFQGSKGNSLVYENIAPSLLSMHGHDVHVVLVPNDGD